MPERPAPTKQEYRDFLTNQSNWDVSNFAAAFLYFVVLINITLGVFNLIPIPPLDGNTAIGLFLSKEQALRFAELSHNRTFSTMGLLIAWQIFGPVFGPIFRFGLNLVYAGNS